MYDMHGKMLQAEKYHTDFSYFNVWLHVYMCATHQHWKWSTCSLRKRNGEEIKASDSSSEAQALVEKCNEMKK
jgi:hypothetical protein